MDEGSENSIYYLLTSLCEKFAVDQSAVRKLRSRVYEILLKKRTNNDSDKSNVQVFALKFTQNIFVGFKTRKGLDPYCNLLAWQFTLATKYGLVEHGTELKECGQYVREHFGDAIIQFLLCLRNVPYDHDDSMVIAV